MTLLGNLLLGATSLLFIFFLFLFLGPRPHHTGDSLMGYVFTAFLLHLLIFAGLLLSGLIAGGTEGYRWLGLQTFFFILILATFIFASAMAAVFRYESGPIPAVFKIPGVVQLLPVILPLIGIFLVFLALNPGVREGLSPALYKFAFWLGTGLAAAGTLGTIAGWMTQSAENARRGMESKKADDDAWVQRNLEQIANTDSGSFEIAHILVFTSKYQPEKVRNSALAKIKSNPAWEQHLLSLMDQGASLESLHFLAYNEVERKKEFAVALESAVDALSGYIERTIRQSSHSAHFYEDQFAGDIERALTAISLLGDQGVDFTPSVRKLKLALETPHPEKKVKYRALAEINKWLSQRE